MFRCNLSFGGIGEIGCTITISSPLVYNYCTHNFEIISPFPIGLYIYLSLLFSLAIYAFNSRL